MSAEHAMHSSALSSREIAPNRSMRRSQNGRCATPRRYLGPQCSQFDGLRCWQLGAYPLTAVTAETTVTAALIERLSWYESEFVLSGSLLKVGICVLSLTFEDLWWMLALSNWSVQLWLNYNRWTMNSTLKTLLTMSWTPGCALDFKQHVYNLASRNQ